MHSKNCDLSILKLLRKLQVCVALALFGACVMAADRKYDASDAVTAKAGSTGGPTPTAGGPAHGGGAATNSSSPGGADAGTGASSGGGGAGDGVSGSGLWVMGYHVGYQRQVGGGSKLIDTLDDRSWRGLTHLAIGPVLPQNDGTLATHFDIDDVNGPVFADETVTAAHAHSVKAMLMVGGAGSHDPFAAAAGASATRAALVTALVGFAKQHGFDGLDLDWEPIDPADEAPVLALLDALREAWPDGLLTLPIGTLNSNFESGRDFHRQLANRVDQLNLMSYAMAGAYPGWRSWHSSPLDGEAANYPTSIRYTVDTLLAAGVVASKLGIGMGFYGICYNGAVTGPRQELNGATLAGDDIAMSFDHIMTSYYAAGDAHFDDTAKVPYLSFAAAKAPPGLPSCRYLSYEDATSIAAKAAFVKARGLGGGIIWTVAEGYRASLPEGQRNPLLDATRQAFVE